MTAAADDVTGAGDVRDRFLDRLGFEPDEFQLRAFDAVDAGRHVIVAAPTGAGKTLVAEYAVDVARAAGRRLFYTTPIKALSNQKFQDLAAVHGLAEVGLLTGDNAINGDAPIVVMTTEVLRNMLYAGTALDRLATVVLDEVHYLQDAYRGPVWEEVIIHLPRRVQLLCLSATVSNAQELAEWVETVRGPTELVVEMSRPVALTNLYLVGERGTSHLHLMKTMQGSRPNPKGSRYDHDVRSGGGRRRGGDDGGRRRKGRPRRRWRTPDRVDVVTELDRKSLLPAIYFIFSRAGCDDAARAVVDAGLQLSSEVERKRIREVVADHVRILEPEDLAILDYDRFRRTLEAGAAPHHAGMVPPFKEAVERCFADGLIKVVFATETLALGINMPARTVVLEKLSKFTGEHHEFLTPAEYTQLTGRAGRRGIDTRGQAVVLWSPYVPFEQVAELASSRRFELRSSFRPTYNMAANLVRRYSPDRARQLLNLSFAQFRADAGVVRAEHRVERLLERRTQLARRLEREFGPLDQLRRSADVDGDGDGHTGAAEGPGTGDEVDGAQAIAAALRQVTPGDVLEVDGPDLPTPVLALAVATRKGGRIRVTATDRAGDVHDLVPSALDRPPRAAGRIELPEPYLPNSVSFVHAASQALSRSRLVSRDRRRSPDIGARRPDRPQSDGGPALARGLQRLRGIDRELARTRRGAATAADSLAATFDRVIELLERRGHVDGWSLTDSGHRLARLYHESDLLAVEAMEDGLFDGLSAAELVALASTLVYEERRATGPRSEPWYPSAGLRRRFRRLQARQVDLNRDEDELRLPATRPPDPGFVAIAHGWAAGGSLDDVLADEELTAGDFVRTAKQLIDLLRQLATLAPEPATATAARRGVEAVHRDLVAASSMLDLADLADEPASEREAERGDP